MVKSTVLKNQAQYYYSENHETPVQVTEVRVNKVPHSGDLIYHIIWCLESKSNLGEILRT